MTTTSSDPQIEYRWKDWTVRHRTDNRSPRPWTVEHLGQRIATFNTPEAAKQQAYKFIREDNGQHTAVRWKQVKVDAPQHDQQHQQREADQQHSQQQRSQQHQEIDADVELAEAGLRLIDALERFVKCIQQQAQP